MVSSNSAKRITASSDDLSALTNYLSSWEFAGYVAVPAVAIGVAGEVIHDFLDWFKSYEWWKTRGNKASGLLLVIALVAELIIQVEANSISGRIIAFLDKETADERAHTAEIEKVAAWRTLEPEATKKLSLALAEIPATVPHKIAFAYAQNDQEALYFMFQIGRLFLADKNWDANIFGETHSGLLYWGIRILGPDNETTQAVRKAFEIAKIDFSTETVPGGSQSYGYMPDSNDTIISVGPKKPPLEP